MVLERKSVSYWVNMAEDWNIKIDSFDGHNFWFWKKQIEAYLYLKELHQPLLGEKPKDMADTDWELLDRKALAEIRLSLSKNVFYNVVNEKTTYGLMKTLFKMYENPSAWNKVFLMRQLVNTRMKEGASVTVHINQLKSIVERLSLVDIKFDEEIQAHFLLSSLPESWSEIVTKISVSLETTKLTFDGICDLILAEDIHRRSSGESSNLLLRTEGRGRNFGRGNNQGRKMGQPKHRKDITCWYCQQVGHFRNKCTTSANC